MTAFKITEAETDTLKSIAIADKYQTACLKILPDFGGNIAELTLVAEGESLKIIDGYQTRKAALEHKGYRGAFLFPFPNRISDGRFSFEGQEFQLPINRLKENCAIHGLFTQQQFELITRRSDDQAAEFLIRSIYKGKQSGYPFPCEVTLSYNMFSASEFRSVVSVKNNGESNLPVAFGWHPYLALGCPADELKLRLPAADILLTNQKNIPTGMKSEMTQFKEFEPIGCSLFDTAFEVKPHDSDNNMAVTELLNERDNWLLTLSQSTGAGGYNYLQLYIPPDRNTVAVEPMTAPANSFNSGEGLICLPPGETTHATFTISLSRLMN